MGTSSANKRIAKNTITLYIRMGITMLISFFTTRITLEVLGVDDYGLNNVVASLVTMFGFINGSMGTAVQRFFSLEIGENKGSGLSKIFGTGLYLHTIVAILSLIIAEIFAIFFLGKMNIPLERMFAAHVVFQISTLSLVINILSVPFAALLRAYEEFSKIAILDVVQALFKLLILFALYQINYDKLIVLSFLNFAVSLFYVIVIVVLTKKVHRKIHFKLVRDKFLIRKMLSFISLLLFTVLASVFDKQGLVIIVNVFFGLAINAAYAIAFSVSSILEFFAMNFKQSVVPQLVQAFGSKDFDRMYRLLYLGTKVAFLLMILISIPAIFEIDYLLHLWLKDPPNFTSTFTIFILISVNIDTFYYFIYQAVHASGKINEQQVFISISYLLSILLVYISFKFGGSFYYAVYIPIVFSVLRNIVVMYSAKKAINFKIVNFIYKITLPCLLVVGVLVLFATFIVIYNDSSIYRVLLLVCINSVSTAIMGYFMILNKQEREFILQLIMKRKSV